jgi:hypothetical protein
MHFTEHIQVSNEPFLCQNFKTNCNVVSYGDHGTERANVMQHVILHHIPGCREFPFGLADIFDGGVIVRVLLVVLVLVLRQVKL